MKPGLLPLFLILTTTASYSAVLSGSVNTAPGNLAAGTAVDLTATGTTNWAAWDIQTSASPTTPRSPSNTLSTAISSGAAGYISPLAGVGGATGNIQGSSTLGSGFFTYSNGVSPASFPAAKFGTAFNTTLDSVGTGLSFSVTGNPANLYRVSVWATGFNGQGTMIASLNGATSIQLVTQTFINGKAPVLFTFDFQPDSAGDLLNLSYTLTTDTPNGTGTTGSNSHVAIQAVTVAIIPEASSAMALLGSLGMLGLIRRRA